MRNAPSVVFCLLLIHSTLAMDINSSFGQDFEIKAATVYVNVVGALAPLVVGSRIELLDEFGKVLREVDTGYATGGSSRLPRPKRLGVFTDVPFGRYKLRVQAPELTTAVIGFVVDRSEKWVTVALNLAPSDRTPGRPRFRIETTPSSIDNPIWAKLVGIYSQFVDEAPIDEKGKAEFVVDPSFYVLILLRGTQICRVIPLNIARHNEKPLVIGLPKECQ
jgi:hypothetical protein